MTNAPERLYVWVSRDRLDASDIPRLDGYPTTEYRRANIPPKVKPLMWDETGCCAKGLGIRYAMSETYIGMFALYSPFHSHHDLTQREMQAAAQADYEARILDALVME